LGFSRGIAGQVLTFRTGAWSSFALPTRRMPLDRYQGIPRADPGGWVSPPVFDITYAATQTPTTNSGRWDEDLSHPSGCAQPIWQLIRFRRFRSSLLALASIELFRMRFAAAVNQLTRDTRPKPAMRAGRLCDLLLASTGDPCRRDPMAPTRVRRGRARPPYEYGAAHGRQVAPMSHCSDH
jgi:hypothetical protein